jgi:hypothetical protein
MRRGVKKEDQYSVLFPESTLLLSFGASLRRGGKAVPPLLLNGTP